MRAWTWSWLRTKHQCAYNWLSSAFKGPVYRLLPQRDAQTHIAQPPHFQQGSQLAKLSCHQQVESRTGPSGTVAIRANRERRCTEPGFCLSGHFCQHHSLCRLNASTCARGGMMDGVRAESKSSRSTVAFSVYGVATDALTRRGRIIHFALMGTPYTLASRFRCETTRRFDN
jgi:hypothetical protein